MLKIAAGKKTPLLLLLITAAPVFYALVIQVKQEVIHRMMKEKLQAHSLHTITIEKENVRWANNEKEIWVDGKMFDIKSFRFQNNAYTFSGLYDEEETILMDQVGKNNQTTSPDSKQLVQIFQLLQTLYSNPDSEAVSLTVLPGPESPPIHFPLYSSFLSVSTPPPQV